MLPDSSRGQIVARVLWVRAHGVVRQLDLSQEAAWVSRVNHTALLHTPAPGGPLRAHTNTFAVQNFCQKA